MDDDDGCDVCGGDHITEHCPVLGYQDQAIAAAENISNTRIRHHFREGCLGTLRKVMSDDGLFNVEAAGCLEVFALAKLTLPSQLDVKQRDDGSEGVVAKEDIPSKTKYGPLEARKSTQDIKSDDHFLLKVLAKDSSVVITFDTSDENECNWLCLVRPALNELEQNCIAYQLGVNIFFSTTKDIKEGDELKVWYAPQYAKKLGKSTTPDGKALTLIGRQDIFNASITEDFGELVKSLSFLTPKPGSSRPQNEIIIEAVQTDNNEVSLKECIPQAQEEDTRTFFEETVSEPAADGAGDAPTIMGGIYLYQCKRCPEKFERESDLARHIRDHIFPWRTNPDVTPPRRPRKKGFLATETYSCEPCNFVFKDYKSYLRHLTKTKRHRLKCHYCDYQTHEKSELVQHLESQHKNHTENTAIKRPVPIMDIVKNSAIVNSRARKKEEEEDDSEDGNESLNAESDESEIDEPMEDTSPSKKTSGEALTPSRVMPKRSLRGIRTTGVLADSVTAVKVIGGKKIPKNLLGKDQDESEDWKAKGQKRKNEDTPPQKRAKIAKGQETKTPSGKKPDIPNRSARLKNKKEKEDKNKSAIDDRRTKKKEDKGENKTTSGKKQQSEMEITKNDFKDDEVKGGDALNEDTEVKEDGKPSEGGDLNVDGELKDGDPNEDGEMRDGNPNEDEEQKDGDLNEDGDQKDGEVNKDEQDCIKIEQNESHENQDGGEIIPSDTDGMDQLEKTMSNYLAKVDQQTHDLDSGSGVSADRSAEGDSEKENNTDVVSAYIANITDDTDNNDLNQSEETTAHSTNQIEDLVEGVDYTLWHTENGVFYSCTACNKRFTKFKYLRLHTPAHTNKYKCEFCDKKFTRKESLDKHSCEVRMENIKVIEEEGQTYYQCLDCKKRFADEEVCRRHYTTHVGRFECCNCLKKFASHKRLMNHDCSDPVGDETLYPCDICKQKFRTQKYLYRHMAMHTDIYKCEKCARCFSRKDSLQKHIMKCCPEFADGMNIYSCEICLKAFATKLGLENHALNCVAFHCKNCKKTFQSEDDLEAHSCVVKQEGQDVNGTDSVRFQCKYCPKDFTSASYVRRHEASHQGAFQCIICSKKFARKEEHSWHYQYCLAVQTLAVAEYIQCDQCEILFQDAKQYRDHYHSHTHPYQCDKCMRRFRKIGTLHMHTCPDSDGEFTCEVCDKSFRNERYLRRHQMCHGDPQYQCPHCDKMFHRKDYLSDHSCVLPDGTRARIIRKNDTIIVKDTVVCHLCGKSFVSSGNLNKHIKIHGEKECECDVCGKKFHYVGYLKEHKASVHEKKYQFQCSDCGKFLYSKTGLQQHMRQFHSEKIVIYTCGTCGKGFRQKGNLKTHMFSHSDQKCFECDICHKKFKYPEQVNRHRLHHTMSNKYGCEFCDRKFVKLYEQRRHMEVFHSGIVFVCGICGTKCGHRHTLTRHYKRKHPNAMEDLNDPTFISSLQKHTNESKAMKAPLIKTEPILHMDSHTATQSVSSIISTITTNTSSALPTTTTGTTVIQNPDGTLTEVRIEGDESIMPQAAAEALHSLQNVIYPTENPTSEQQTHVVYESQNAGQQTQHIVYETENVEEQTVTIPNNILEAQTVESGVDIEEGEQTLVILQYVNSDGEEEQIIQSLQQ